MGYDMNLCLTVTPEERFQEIADVLATDAYGYRFEDNEDWESSGMVRWPDMSDDLLKLSLQFPDVRISMRAEGEDGNEWIEHHLNGNYYVDSRPEWEPPPFDPEKFNHNRMPQVPTPGFEPEQS